jgi:hypothetical protein
MCLGSIVVSQIICAIWSSHKFESAFVLSVFRAHLVFIMKNHTFSFCFVLTGTARITRGHTTLPGKVAVFNSVSKLGGSRRSSH